MMTTSGFEACRQISILGKGRVINHDSIIIEAIRFMQIFKRLLGG